MFAMVFLVYGIEAIASEICFGGSFNGEGTVVSKCFWPGYSLCI